MRGLHSREYVGAGAKPQTVHFYFVFSFWFERKGSLEKREGEGRILVIPVTSLIVTAEKEGVGQ